MTNKGTIYTIQSKSEDFPDTLRHIPQPPSRIYVRGSLTKALKRPCVAIVGSRRITAYGRAVTAQLAEALARAGVTIISGLAIGVDAVAHRAALEAGGITAAVLAGGLDAIHPSSNARLAEQIINQGGALISEYPIGIPSYPGHFVARNRLVSGLSAAVLITEAASKSGTLHTANFALEQGREVFAVPGNITSPQSAGTNQLIRTGATPLTSSDDILQALGLEKSKKQIAKGATPQEQCLIDLLGSGIQDGGLLLEKSHLPIAQFNQTLTMLEITGIIRSLGANQWTL